MTLEQYLLAGVSGFVGAVAIALTYVKLTTGACRSQRDLQGKTVIVTGANSGIGLETARDLAARNARVILACRNTRKAEEAKEDIINTTGNENVIVMKLDVSSLQSVTEFVKEIQASEKRLDILINNAGVMVLPSRERSADGLDMIMATNHFGPFLLTNLLLPMMMSSAPSRIVNVSSMVHEWAKMDFENLNGEKAYNMLDIYGVSKLASVLFTIELAERLKGSGVSVNALHPGAVRTHLTRNLSLLPWIAINVIFGCFLKNTKQGAQTSIHVAVAEEVEGVSGKYFSDCCVKKLRGHASDMAVAKRLWDHSETVTKLNETLN